MHATQAANTQKDDRREHMYSFMGGSTQEVRRHGQAHLVGAIRSRSPACIFLIRTQIIGRCCCIISHQGVARPCAFGRQEVYLNAGAPLQLGRLSVDMFCASSLSETRTIS